MRKILNWTAIAAVALLARVSDGAALKTPATSSHSGRRKAAVKGTTWRNRQLAPTPARYKEIQGALAAKGYLKPEDAHGSWNQASVAALTKFQSEQILGSTGKINSLSLIALGLGPRHDTAVKPAPVHP